MESRILRDGIPAFSKRCWEATLRRIYGMRSFPGYTEQWNVAVQHQFNNGVSVEAGYVGLAGKHLPAGIGLNFNLLPSQYVTQAAADPNGFGGSGAGGLREQVANPFFGLIKAGTLSTATIQRGLLLLPFPEYGNIGWRPSYSAASQYHSLQLRADKRFERRRGSECELHVLQEHRQCGNLNHLAGIR